MHAMSESAKRQSNDQRSRDKQQSTSSDDRARDRSADKSRAGLEAQKEAARTQPPSPGEPAGGE